jgi:hypothetical protein
MDAKRNRSGEDFQQNAESAEDPALVERLTRRGARCSRGAVESQSRRNPRQNLRSAFGATMEWLASWSANRPKHRMPAARFSRRWPTEALFHGAARGRL